MTRGRRILSILEGIVMLVMGMALLIYPEKGIIAVAIVISISFTLNGINTLLFYLTMAINMVEGRKTLYRGMLYLDIGILTSAVVSVGATVYIALYLAVIHVFYGAVDILRSREEKSGGSPGWRWTALNGVINIMIAICVIIGGIGYASARVVVYIYAAGVIYSAMERITRALRRTAIVYIQ